MSLPATAFDTIDQFKQAMAEAGLAYDDQHDLIDDGQIHRYHVDGDKPGKRNGWYVLYTDGVPAGSFGTWRQPDVSHTWCAKSERELTSEEKAANRERIEQAKAKREAERQKRIDKARKLALEIWNESTDAVGHEYLQKKNVRAHGIRITVTDYDLKTQSDKTLRIPTGSLVIPMRDTDATIWSLQFITPGGDKWFLPGGDPDAHYHAMGQPGGRIMVVEGYATGATCLEAAGGAVAVAFNAGNLIKVARALRDTYPDAELVIGADNDQFTTLPDGTENPGVTKAREAAREVGAQVVIPQFSDDHLESEPTDWNDLQQLAGIGEVARQLGGDEPPVSGDEEPPVPPDDMVPATDDEDVYEVPDGGPDQNQYFRPLGHDRGTFFFITSRGKQVNGFPLRTLASKTTLLALAPLHWWEREYPHEKGFTGKAVDQAVNALIAACYARGVFRVDRMRGRGAWWDDGRVVFHAGNQLFVDGQAVRLQEHDSRFVYEALPEIRVLPDSQLRSDEAHRLHELCTALAWERGAFGAMLAGWVVVAPVCGALEWRPHIWVTGASGSGKSWVVANIVRPALGANALQAQGDSSAAGIRQALGHDALPVVFDEAEGEDHRAAQNIQGVLALMRQASSETGGQILKGGADGGASRYTVRSAFCMSSIVPQLRQTADEARVTVLTLRKSDGTAEGQRHFQQHIEPLAKQLLTEEFVLRLQARTLQHLPTLRANTRIFSTAVAAHLGSQRLGDQYGPLIAGDYLLHSTREITPEQASAWVQKQDWGEQREAAAERDELKLLARLMESVVMVEPETGKEFKATVAQLVEGAAGQFVLGEEARLTQAVSQRALQYHGMKVRSDRLLVSNTNKQTEALLAGTPWASGWRRVLARIDGAEPVNKSTRFAGAVSKALAIPLEIIIGRADE